jgi:hypothetical protein
VKIIRSLYVAVKMRGVCSDDGEDEKWQKVVSGAGLHGRCHGAKNFAAVDLRCAGKKCDVLRCNV